MMLVVKNPPANAGDIKDINSTSGSGRGPGESPRTEEPGELQSVG